MNYIRKFWNDEEGLETVEYAILLGLIVAGTIAAVIGIGTWVNTQFTTTETLLEDGGVEQ